MTPEILTRARDLIEPELHKGVKGLNEDIARAVSYHFGWEDENGSPTSAATSGSGKGIRPALAILSAEYAGGNAETAIPGAIAVELVHNFSLLHDDVIDKDQERRHRPTVWKVFGIEDAIIAGDALLALAFQMLIEVVGTTSTDAVAELAGATSKMIAGQRADMATDRIDSVKACQKMESEKTGALLSCSASIGAILAGADAKAIEALRAYGMELGLAFQAVDDLLGIWGDPEITGKPAGNDIRERKKSLPIVLALEEAEKSAAGLHQKLIEALAKENLQEPDIAFIIQILEELDTKTKTQEIANRHLKQSLNAIQKGHKILKDAAKNETAKSALGELEELAKFVATRDF